MLKNKLLFNKISLQLYIIKIVKEINMLKNMTIRLKLRYAMLILAAAIISVIYFSVTGMKKCVNSSHKITIDSKKLEHMGKIIISHEQFLAKMEKALLQNRQIKTELNEKLCSIGKWLPSFLVSKDFKHLPKEIQDKLTNITQAHNTIHKIAQNYNANYIHYDREIERIILQKELEHLRWAMSLSKSIIAHKEIQVQTDPSKCHFGTWWTTYKNSTKFQQLSKDMQKLFLTLNETHTKLHKSSQKIQIYQNEHQYAKAQQYYKTHILVYLDSYKETISFIRKNIEKKQKHNYPIEYSIEKTAFQQLLVIEDGLKSYEKALDKDIKAQEKDEKKLVIDIDNDMVMISLVSLLVFLLMMAVLQGILNSIEKFEVGLNSFFDYLKEPTTSVEKIDIDSNDEFGKMSRSVNESISYSVRMHSEMSQLMISLDKNIITSETDDKGIITYVSEAFCTVSGYTKEELLGKPHSIVRHPDMPKEVFKKLWDTIKDNRVWEGEVKNLRKDGSFYWVKTIISPKCTKGGASCGYTAIRYDITDKKEVEDLTANLEVKIEERTLDLEVAKKQVEATHKHTRDSIEYASLIQGALIPQKGAIAPYFKDHFVTWTPKDTVGGDIWLFEELRHEDECLMMFIDCTGHGVPGAFVTMIVKAVEREIVSIINSTPSMEVSPAWIMKYFNRTIKTLLRQETKESISNAGWDGGIIYYNRRDQVLKFAGAETPLFYVTKEGEFKTIKGNRYSVGYKKCDPDYEYKETSIDVEEGMKFYCTTDGYLDQNGGEKGFPFGKKRFSNIIKENYKESMAEQQTVFMMDMMEYESEIENNDRNDDMTVIGFEIGEKSEYQEDVVVEIVKYEGVMTQNVIATCMDNIEAKITDMNLIGTISTITIENCQNMMNYSKNAEIGDKQIVGDGTIEVQHINEDYYHIIASNVLSKEDKEKIEPKLKEIQSLDKQGIRKRYRELRKSGVNAHEKGGGIGIYEIAKVSESIEYEFNAINEDKYTYILKSIVRKKAPKEK